MGVLCIGLMIEDVDDVPLKVVLRNADCGGTYCRNHHENEGMDIYTMHARMRREGRN